MNHSDLVDAFAAKAKITKVDANKYIYALAEAIEEGLIVANDSVRFGESGAFKVIKRAARAGQNPRTKEKIAIPEKLAIVFRTSKGLTDKVNGVKKVDDK
jgi:DNA-binding protein HU-beta